MEKILIRTFTGEWRRCGTGRSQVGGHRLELVTSRRIVLKKVYVEDFFFFFFFFCGGGRKGRGGIVKGYEVWYDSERELKTI